MRCKLAIGGTAEGVACEGCPPLERLFADYAADGGGLFVCPICFDARKLDAEQLVDNATDRRRDAAVGVDRRRRDRVQLLR